MVHPLQDKFDRALACYREGDWGGAKAILESVLAHSPMEVEALALAALCSFRLEEYALAEEIAHSALLLQPNHSVALETIGMLEKTKSAARAQPYFREYMLYRNRYALYPRSVAIETTGRCNASCDFCPHAELERNKVTMDDALFLKIIADLEKIPRDHEFTICPNVVNEPFMDRHFFERMQIINARLPHAAIVIFSNMNVMHRDFEERIVTVRNLKIVNVSFNAAEKTEYERVMQIDFDRTVRNLKRLMRLNRQFNFVGMPIVLSRVADLTSLDEAFLPQTRALFSEFEEGQDYVVKVKNRTTWLDRMDGLVSSAVPSLMPCGAWFDLNIHCDGTVPHCCMDSDGKFAIGNVSESSVLEIYNAREFSELRKHATNRGSAGFPCNRCALLQ